MRILDSQGRIERVKDDIAQNRMGDAVAHLMDLAREFNDGQITASAVIIKRQYTAMWEGEHLGLQDRIDEQDHLVARMLGLLEYLGQYPNVSNIRQVGEGDLDRGRSSDAIWQIFRPLDAGGFVADWKAFQKDRASSAFPTAVVFQGKRICKSYGSSLANFSLGPIDVQLSMGEITAVVGPNGSGKTTLLNIVAGALNADEGEAKYPLFELTTPGDAHAIRREIGHIPQVLQPWPSTVIENLLYVASNRGLRSDRATKWVDFILARFDLDRYANHKWNELSGGLKMRCALARTVLWNPKLVVLDEPLANLDVPSQWQFLRDIRSMANSSEFPLSVILTTQHIDVAEALADQLIFLRDGEAAFQGKADSFGLDRKENTFELHAEELSKFETARIFEGAEMGLRGIDEEGMVQTISFDISTTSDQVLRHISEKSAGLRLFRDISKSTRKLFGRSRERRD